MRPRKIQVLIAVRDTIVNGANRTMEEVYGPHAANTFTVPVGKGGALWYVACGVLDVAKLQSLKDKIANQLLAGNAKIWTNKGRLQLTEDGFTFSTPT